MTNDQRKFQEPIFQWSDRNGRCIDGVILQNMRGLMIAIGVVSIVYGVVMLLDWGMFSTRYAAGYSESGFMRIRTGMSTNEAIRLVGRLAATGS